MTQSPTTAELDEGQVTPGIDLQHREVGLVVGSDDGGGQPGAVGEIDLDLVGALDDMVVGDDRAICADDEAGAQAARLLHPLFAETIVRIALVEEVFEWRPIRHFGKGHADPAWNTARGADIHDRRRQGFCQRSHRFGTVGRGRCGDETAHQQADSHRQNRKTAAQQTHLGNSSTPIDR